MGGERSGLAEVDEILEGESQLHRFRQLNLDVVLGLFHLGAASERDGTIANIASTGELDTILGRLNVDYQASISASQRSSDRVKHT